MKPALSITSSANPLIKKIKGLALKKNRDASGLFVVEGMRHTIEALNAGWTLDLLALVGGTDEFPPLAAALSQQGGGTLITIPHALMQSITSRDNAQKVLAVFQQRFSVLERINPDKNSGVWVMLEAVRDPGNLGTILRTADAAGAAGVILAGVCCDPFSPEAVRASMGSFARMNLVGADTQTAIDWIQDFPGPVIGTHMHATQDYRDLPPTRPALLVMGNEQAGLSEDIAKACRIRVRIPMVGSADSLNLAVATGIMLYEIKRGQL